MAHARSISRALIAAAASIAFAAPTACAQVEDSAVAQAGRDSFMRYCASCHGTDARGGGPVAPALKTPPPDLTEISERRDGAFPLLELADLIDGRTIPAAHGGREMPVWGRSFRKKFGEDGYAEEMIRGEIRVLLTYLEHIQR